MLHTLSLLTATTLAPPSVVAAVQQLHRARGEDPRLLLPVLPALGKDGVVAVLPRIVLDLPPKHVQVRVQPRYHGPGRGRGRVGGGLHVMVEWFWGADGGVQVAITRLLQARASADHLTATELMVTGLRGGGTRGGSAEDDCGAGILSDVVVMVVCTVYAMDGEQLALHIMDLGVAVRTPRSGTDSLCALWGGMLIASVDVCCNPLTWCVC